MVVLICLSTVGCGDDGRAQLAVGVQARFQSGEGPPRTAGYWLVMLIDQVVSSAHPQCPKLPSTLRLQVNDTDVTPAYDADTGCLSTSVILGPAPKFGTVTVDAQDGDGLRAHAQFDGLTPGGDAALAAPVDGIVHAGDDVVVVPPPALSTSGPTAGYVYPLDDTSVSSQLLPAGPPDRRADGLHMTMPAFSGRAAVTFTGMPFVTLPTYSCPGFDACIANSDTTLGPVFVTEAP
jgi:hypothetical protein